MVSERIIELEDYSFDRFISEISTPLLIDFWAEWCGPCKRLAPLLEELAAEYSGKVTVCELNITTSPNTTKNYNVMRVPTMIIMKDRQEIGRTVGYQTKEQLERWLLENL